MAYLALIRQSYVEKLHAQKVINYSVFIRDDS